MTDPNLTQPEVITLALPSWTWDVVAKHGPVTDPQHQVELVLDLVERNIAEGGGPFAAAVFGADGTVIAPGVNRVVPDCAPIAHAEMVAIAAAGQRLGTWDLAAHGPLRLVTSTEPCAMCLGAVPWSGVSSLVIAARDADARAAGFDEGDKAEHWPRDLARRGIVVERDVGRERAAALLAAYAVGGGTLYNGGGAGAGDRPESRHDGGS